MIYYAGIGSRETPEVILNMFTELGSRLAGLGLCLRSGRAAGADSAFERGCIRAGGSTEIFIPWFGFPKGSDLVDRPAFLFDYIEPAQKQRALDSIQKYHPAPDRLSSGAMKLMARNYCQMFGKSVSSPASSFVVCYTKDGKASGGTGQAIRMAEDAGIMIFNAHGCENCLDDFIQKVVDYAEVLVRHECKERTYNPLP